MKRIHIVYKCLSILSIAVLIAFVHHASAEDCPCSPCPGGVYGCEDGCISICYPDTNQCYASCTKGKSLEIMPSIKLDKGKTLRRIHINNVPSGNVKPLLEQLYKIELATESEAKTNRIKVKADNVDLIGILAALEEQGLVLKFKREGKYRSPEELQKMLNSEEARLSADRKKIINQKGEIIAEEIAVKTVSKGSCPGGATELCWRGCAEWVKKCYLDITGREICVRVCDKWEWKCICPKEPWQE